MASNTRQDLFHQPSFVGAIFEVELLELAFVFFPHFCFPHILSVHNNWACEAKILTSKIFHVELAVNSDEIAPVRGASLGEPMWQPPAQMLHLLMLKRVQFHW
eukprot:CAMPEP_0179231354 /NCGR_PEP_ID=MMETSP0797-20121207/11301_1 /TAXON_ID=47934 /ORGANISM="Dinophysis acuminata, Strain DAEP01" /LENGTH=102 /DNA_ID=CAMNT_0020938441 /DNA_START=900 /DNA_END=1205 /DNA_ORIENTATION=-